MILGERIPALEVPGHPLVCRVVSFFRIHLYIGHQSVVSLASINRRLHAAAPKGALPIEKDDVGGASEWVNSSICKPFSQADLPAVPISLPPTSNICRYH